MISAVRMYALLFGEHACHGVAVVGQFCVSSVTRIRTMKLCADQSDEILSCRPPKVPIDSLHWRGGDAIPIGRVGFCAWPQWEAMAPEGREISGGPFKEGQVKSLDRAVEYARGCPDNAPKTQDSGAKGKRENRQADEKKYVCPFEAGRGC